MTTIESKNEHGRVECKCGIVTISGGKKTLERYGNKKDFVEKSIIEISCERKVK